MIIAREDGRERPDDAADVVGEFLRAAATARTQLHAGQASQRLWSQEADLVGLAGEAAFAADYGQALDLRRRRQGDRGIDFVVPLAFTVDVKCFRNPTTLLHAQGKVVADIYVLAGYREHDCGADLLGWEWGRNLAAAPLCDPGQRGVPAHYIKAGRLRDMRELARRLMWRHVGGHLTPGAFPWPIA
jgi:hypothetical protein